MQSVLFIGPRPGIPSARSIHSAEFRRITYRGIVRSTAGAHYGLTRSAAHDRTSPAPSRHLNGNSSGATAPINKAPRPRPAPSFLARVIPPRSIRDCFVSAVPSPGAPRVLSLRSFTGELPPAAQPARWPRASSPRRCAGGSARTATRQPQRRLRRRGAPSPPSPWGSPKRSPLFHNFVRLMPCGPCAIRPQSFTIHRMACFICYEMKDSVTRYALYRSAHLLRHSR
jgi:hypothetical protein